MAIGGSRGVVAGTMRCPELSFMGELQYEPRGAIRSSSSHQSGGDRDDRGMGRAVERTPRRRGRRTRRQHQAVGLPLVLRRHPAREAGRGGEADRLSIDRAGDAGGVSDGESRRAHLRDAQRRLHDRGLLQSQGESRPAREVDARAHRVRRRQRLAERDLLLRQPPRHVRRRGAGELRRRA